MARTPSTSRAALIVVGGPPASGKTTLADRLAETLAAVRLSPDEWMRALALDLLDAPARDRVETLQWDLARSLLGRGLAVVLDWGVFTRAKRDALREGARELGAAVHLHFLDEPAELLWSRIEQRVADGERSTPTREQFERMLSELEPPEAVELALFDPAPGASGDR